MAGFPEPVVGLVISYSYVWRVEAEQGRTERRKDPPCAIVLALDAPAAAQANKNKQIAVVPITHSPSDPNVAIEIPPAIKRHLGLDRERSWAVLNEINVFIWPGYDLRPIKDEGDRIDYGLLPPRFFDLLIQRYAELDAAGKVAPSSRD